MADPRVKVAGVLALAVLLRVVFFVGYNGYDDVYYIQRAWDLSQGLWDVPQTAWAARLGVVGPTALAYRAWGVTPVTTNLWPLLCSLSSVLAAYALGKRLFGSQAGLLSGLLLAVFPFDVLFASELFPTAPVVLFAGASLGLFVLGERDGSSLTYLASGVAFGLALVVHEGAVMCLAFYPVYLAMERKLNLRHGWVALGVLLGAGVDPLLNVLLFGDPAARLQGIRGSHAQMLDRVADDVAYAGFNLAWIGEPMVRPFFERTFGLYPWLLVAAWWAGVRAARGSMERALAWIVAGGALWIYYGTISISHYSPMSRMPRYLAPLMLPATWLLARWLMQRTSKQRTALCAALGVSSLLCLALDPGDALPPHDQVVRLLHELRPSRVIAGDPFPLSFAEGMRPAYRLEAMRGAQLQAGVVAVVRDGRPSARVAAAPGAKLIAQLRPPSTLYLRVLRSSMVMALLRATRPPDRFAEYRRKVAPPTLNVYVIQ